MNAAIIAHVVAGAPDAISGQAVSATVQLTTLFHPLGPAVVGIFIDAAGTGAVITVYGAAFVALALVVTLTPVLRRG